MMHTAQISLIRNPNPPIEAEQETNDCYWYGDEEDLLNVIGSLQNNGQVMGSDYPMIEKDGTLIAFVNIAEANSLDNKYHNKYVKELIETFADRVSFTVLGEDPASCDTCQCKNNQQRQFLLLHTNFLSSESPIDCGNCELPVSLYKLKKTYNYSDEYCDILSWQQNFQSFDRLHIHSMAEDFSHKQLSDIDSEFTVSSLELCQDIARAQGIPVYYYLYKHYGDSIEAEEQRKCPSCSGDWKLDKAYRDTFNFKCDKCHLLSNIAFDVE